MCAGIKRELGDKAANWKGGRRIDKSGYVLIYSPNHPFARTIKCVPEHRLVMEKHLGRYLLPTEIVHHINHIKSDNRIENLELIGSQSEQIRHEFATGGMKGSMKTQFKEGQNTWGGKKLSPEHREKCIKTLTPFKKGHPYYPRKKVISHL